MTPIHTIEQEIKRKREELTNLEKKHSFLKMPPEMQIQEILLKNDEFRRIYSCNNRGGSICIYGEYLGDMSTSREELWAIGYTLYALKVEELREARAWFMPLP